MTCDVTYDDLRGLTAGICASLKSYIRYSCVPKGDNLIIKNNVSTPSRRIKLIIYDKEAEMRKAKNVDYRAQTGCSDFKGIIRFEMNLTSMTQIRERLKLTDTTLMPVLNSSATPIIDFLNEIIVDKTVDINKSMKFKNADQYKNWLLVRECDYDPVRVQMTLRQYSSPKVSVKQMMKPYREFLDNYKGDSINIREELNHLLPNCNYSVMCL